MSDNRYTRYNREEDEEEDLLYKIESEDSEPLYYLEEEEDDKFPEDNTEMEEEDDDQEEIDEEEGENDDEANETFKGKGNLILLLLKILATPVEGWKEFKRRRYTVEETASGCFYPLTAIAAISCFADMIYKTVTLSVCVMNALNVFISLFFGYFTVIILGGLFLPKVVSDIVKKEIGKEFVMINMSSLALFYSAVMLFQMIDAILVFLPLWTIYLIYKGVKILRIPEEVATRTKIIFTFLIIGAPVLWNWLFSLVF